LIATSVSVHAHEHSHSDVSTPRRIENPKLLISLEGKTEPAVTPERPLKRRAEKQKQREIDEFAPRRPSLTGYRYTRYDDVQISVNNCARGQV
jgi:hypothetical protein